MLRILLFICIISGSSYLLGQGRLLVIGGGGEKFQEQSWERMPYQWAVDESVNRKVAIISFYAQNQDLPNFFVEELGAVSARNFRIDSEQIAQDQATYDSLMTYDVIFLKGGDQYNYYSTYRGTLTEQAIMDKFQEGGVICGTSAGLAVLGGVDYVAALASADPAEAILDPGNPDLTLEMDFLPLLPGVIFDSHFAERGRFGRLLGFLARWQHDHGEKLLGIGVDDMTALVIDSTLQSTVYGTGAVNLYRLPGDREFYPPGSPLGADSVEVTQLLHRCTFNFNTGNINGLNTAMNIAAWVQQGDFEVLISGGESLEDNQTMIRALVDSCGSSSDPILVLSRTLSQVADDFVSLLKDSGAPEVVRAAPVLSEANNLELRDQILGTRKFLLVDLNLQELLAFLENGPAGSALDEQIHRKGICTALVGDAGRVAGQVMVNGTLDPGASYEGRMTLSEGLNLLSHTVIQPHTFLRSDIYENTASSVPYAMVLSHLRYGIWLNPGNYMHYHAGEDKPWIRAHGDMPLMVMEALEGLGDVSDQTSYGDGQDQPRQVAGFSRMFLSVLRDGQRYPLGEEVYITHLDPASMDDFQVYPNPSDGIFLLHTTKRGSPVLVDLQGRIRWKGSEGTGSRMLHLHSLENGTYLLGLEQDGKAPGIFQKIQIINP